MNIFLIMKNKTCTKCGKEKTISEFTFRKDSGKHRNQCKQCIKEQHQHHKCIECNNLVYRKKAKRCRSCANKYIAQNCDKSYFRSKEHRKFQSKLMIRRLQNPKNHPLYIDGRSLGRCICKKCGIKISQTSVYNKSLCKTCSGLSRRGKNAHNYVEKIKKKCLFCHSEFQVAPSSISRKFCNNKCLSEYKKTYYKGKKNPNWHGGISSLPYSFAFNSDLKDYIRQRDNYVCQKCGLHQVKNIKTHNRRLSVHHVDYNKQNCKENNLVSLCTVCHGKTNNNRDYWFAYFKYILENHE